MSKEKELYSEIQKFLEKFPEIEFDGKKVKDIQYDGWPIWWFFKQRFLGDHLISPLASHREIIKSILNNKKPRFKQNFKNKIVVFTLRKFLEYNEKSKLWVSEFNKKKSPTTGKKRIMFMAHTNAILPDEDYGYTVDRVSSVVKKVRDDPELEEYISIIDPLSHKSSLKLLKYENLVYSHVDREIKKKARKESSFLHKKWKEISKNRSYNSELEGNIAEQFRPALDVFFSGEIIYLLILYYETYKKIIKQEKIKLTCFYAGGGVLSKCAIAASHKSGIKFLFISHGLGASTRNPDQPDSVYYATIGSKYKESLIKLGVSPENISVIGPVFIDEVVPYIKRKHLENKRKIILLATKSLTGSNILNKDIYVRYISKFLKEINKLNNIEIIMKLHPREKNLHVYQSIIDSSGYNNVKLIGSRGVDQLKSRLYDLIHKSDIVMSFGSTVSVEAMIIGRPSLVIDLMPGSYIDPVLNDKKKMLHITQKEDVSKIVRKILYDEKFKKEVIDNEKKLIQEYLYKVDGRAGGRVLEIIKELSK